MSPEAPGPPPADVVAEVVLFSFGPFGVSICDGPYSMFKWQRKNATTVELTNFRLLASPGRKAGLFRLPSLSRRATFEIPYASMLSVNVHQHPARLGLMDVLDIQYRESGTLKEKSICSYSASIDRACGVIQSNLKSRGQ